MMSRFIKEKTPLLYQREENEKAKCVVFYEGILMFSPAILLCLWAANSCLKKSCQRFHGLQYNPLKNSF